LQEMKKEAMSLMNEETKETTETELALPDDSSGEEHILKA